MRFLELKIPPVIVFLAVGLFMYGCAYWVPAATYPIPGRRLMGFVMVAWGLLVGALSVSAFRSHQTTVNPHRPGNASMLVTRGIYRQTRNPMYLGLLFLLTGWGFYLSNVLAFLGLPLFVLYMTEFQIKPEERALAQKFGTSYIGYTSMAKRWWLF
ncbi:MAG: isoprenylcysteine carboxylmethyltransferase family protein [Lautropia sp.]|nr:isoprenylcysteine carboxylmethyltransferase family protein [Lautropia sp.]